MIPVLLRGGASLAEICVAIVIGGLLCAVLLGVLRQESRHAAGLGDAAVLAEALRIPHAILMSEVRYLYPPEDLGEVGEDSLPLRAFRGLATVCGEAGGDPVIRYRGLRLPEPAKDSVLIMAPGGTAAAELLGAWPVGGDSCAGEGWSAWRWRLGTETAAGDLLLLYERGSYHLADHTFRYRRGDGGRQPLAPEAFTRAAGRFSLRAGEAIHGPVDDAARFASIRVILWPDTARAMRVVTLDRERVFRILNARDSR